VLSQPKNKILKNGIISSLQNLETILSECYQNKAMVLKIIELVGSSPQSWEEATKEAVSKAQESVKDIRGVDLIAQTAVVKNGQITEYRANVKIGFVVE